MMYSVGVSRTFAAWHYLIGGDWGSENEKHKHVYRVEAAFEGPKLDDHGYLLDITEVESHLDAVVESLRDRTLNDLPDFAGLNPSVERLARLICRRIGLHLKSRAVASLRVTVWESETAWASFRQDVP